MERALNIANRNNQSRSMPLAWLAALQAYAVFTIWALVRGGESLRAWLLLLVTTAMALPLLVSLEACMTAMIVFEPFRGILRRAQYLIVSYTESDPIHILTPVVTALAFAVLLKVSGPVLLTRNRMSRYISILGIVYLLEVFNPLQGGLSVGLAGAVFMLVPIAWFYFGQEMNQRFLRTILVMIPMIGLVGSLYGVYQLTAGYPHFEQYWIDHTEYYDSIAVGHVTRALATFSSAEEWGRYVEIGGVISVGMALKSRQLSGRLMWLLSACGLMVGLLLSGQRTAIFGLLSGILILILTGARNWRGAVTRLLVCLLPAALVAVLSQAPSEDEMWRKDESETVSTLISHSSRGTLHPTGEDSFQIRLENWSHLILQVMPNRPLGTGLGSGSLAAARYSEEADLPPIDNFILVVGIACGPFVAIFFAWILISSCIAAFKVHDRLRQAENELAPYARIVAALLPVLLLNSIFGLTFTLYAVAPIGWLLIGWANRQRNSMLEPSPGRTLQVESDAY